MTKVFCYSVYDKLAEKPIASFFGANDKFAKRQLEKYKDKYKDIVDPDDLCLYSYDYEIFIPDNQDDIFKCRLVC